MEWFEGLWCRVGGLKSQTGLTARIVLVLAAATLAGCGSTISQIPGIGMPSNAPAAPTQSKGYLPVNDLPDAREQAPLDASQQVLQEILSEVAR